MKQMSLIRSDREVALSIRRRRYYLHSRVKPYLSLRVRKKLFMLTADEFDNAPDKIKHYVYELVDKHKYNLQFKAV